MSEPDDDATESELPAADPSELVDDDVLPPEYPPDRPLGVDEYGTTWQEERDDEPLEERVRREEPDVVGLDPDADLEAIDVGDTGEDDLHGDLVLPAEDRLDDGDPVGGDPSRRDVAQERVAAPAEEAAIHVVDDGGA